MPDPLRSLIQNSSRPAHFAERGTRRSLDEEDVSEVASARECLFWWLVGTWAYSAGCPGETMGLEPGG